MVDEQVWIDKDKKIIRQNCVGNAVRLAKDKPNVSIDDVLVIAAAFEEWVHRK